MSTSQPNTALSQSPEAAIADVLKQAAERNPTLEQAILWCAVPRWFDAEFVEEMFSSQEASTIHTDEIIQYISSLPFSQPHPTRDKTWLYREEFRAALLKLNEITLQAKMLQSRAAAHFKKRFDARAPEGEKKFEDRGLKDIANAYVYHLQQLDPLKALKALRQICAETLAVLTTVSGRPEVVFCSRFLADLDWPGASDHVEQELSFLRSGISALLTEDDVRALKMLYQMAEIPGLDAQEESSIRDWIGTIHLRDQGLLAPALEQLKRAEAKAPNDPFVHAHLAELYSQSGLIWGRLDRAEQHAHKAMELGSDKIDGYLALGKIAELHEDYDSALAWYQKVIDERPKSFSGYLPQSEVYSARGDLIHALEKIDKALKVSPDIKYYALVRKGNAYRDARRYKESLEEYVKARDEAPDRIDAYIGVGGVHATLWHLAEAEEAYRKAIELNPESPEGHDGLALLYEQQEKLQRAIDECRKAMTRGIESKQLYYRLIGLYRQQGRLEDLQKVQEELVQFDPGEEYAAYCTLGDAWLGKAWRSDDQYGAQWRQEAQSAYERALDNDPDRAWAHLSMAKLAVLQKDEYTIQEHKRYVSERLSWAQYDLLLSLGRAYLENFQYAEAEKQLRDAVKLAPRRIAGWQALRELYYQQSDTAGVLQACFEQVNINPTLEYEKHMRSGEAYERAADLERSREEYTQAKELEPETSEAYLALAVIAEEEGKWAEAIDQYLMVANVAPALASIAYIRIARIYLSQEQNKEAEEAVRTSIRLDSEEPSAYIEQARLGVIQKQEGLVTESRQTLTSMAPDKLYDFDNAMGDEYRQTGNLEKAEQAYRECIRRTPERAEAYVGLGKLRLTQGRPQGAEEWLPEALKIDRTNVEAYLAVGEMYEKLGQLDKAEHYLQTAIKLSPWRPEAHLFLASLLHRRGESEAAREAYLRAKRAAGASYLDLGSYYELQRKLDDAIEVYRLGLEYEPAAQKSDFYLALASLYARLNNPEQANEQYRQALISDPNAAVYTRYAEWLTDENRLDEALEVCRQMAKQPEMSYDAHLLMGDLLAATKAYTEARSAYEQAIAVDPKRVNAYVQLARVYYEESKFDETEKILLQASDRIPNTPEPLLHLAQLREDAARWDEAIKLYHRILELDLEPLQRCDAYILIANAYEKKKDSAQAATSYRQALDLDPNNQEAYVGLAQLLTNENRIDEALEVCRQMAKHPGLAYTAQISIGNLLAAKEAYSDATSAYREAIAVDPKEVRAYVKLANLYYELGKIDQTEQILLQASDAIPTSPEPLRLLAQLKEEDARWGEAIKLYRRILELDLEPAEKYDAYILIATAYEKATDSNQATTFYRQALELEPKRQEAYVGLAQLLTNENRIDEALELCRQMAEHPELAYNAQISIGNLLAAKGADNEAISAYRQAIDLAPEHADAYLQLAWMYEQQNKPEEAITLYRRVLELQPEGAEASQTHVRLSKVLTQQRRYDEAEQELQQAVQGDSENAATYYNVGTVYEEQVKIESALENYHKAIELAPRYWDAYVACFRIYAYQGDAEKLAQMARQILELDLVPVDRYEAYLLIANAYQRAALYELAIDYLKKATSLDPGRFEAYNSLGIIYEIQQSWAAARDTYEKLSRVLPELQQEVHLKVGQLFVADGNAEEAEKRFSEVNSAAMEAAGYRLLEQLTAGYLNVASIYRKQSKLEAMKRASAEVVSLVQKSQSSDHNMIRHQGLAYLMRGEYAEATPTLRRALEANPDDIKARLYLAVNLVPQSEPVEAQSQLKQAIDGAEHKSDYDYAIEEAEVFAVGMPEVAGAKEMLEKLREAREKTPE